MVIFHSYVKLPEGIPSGNQPWRLEIPRNLPGSGISLDFHVASGGGGSRHEESQNTGQWFFGGKHGPLEGHFS